MSYDFSFNMYDLMDVVGPTVLFGVFAGAIFISLLTIIAVWKIYTKAGYPGWASIIPFYSNFVMAKFTMGNGWLFLILAVPFVGAIFGLVMKFKLCKCFGKGIGMFILSLICFPLALLILAFGKSYYIGDHPGNRYEPMETRAANYYEPSAEEERSHVKQIYDRTAPKMDESGDIAKEVYDAIQKVKTGFEEAKAYDAEKHLSNEQKSDLRDIFTRYKRIQKEYMDKNISRDTLNELNYLNHKLHTIISE